MVGLRLKDFFSLKSPVHNIIIGSIKLKAKGAGHDKNYVVFKTCVKSGIDNHLEVPSHRLCNIWLKDQHYEPKKEGTDEIICSY